MRSSLKSVILLFILLAAGNTLSAQQGDIIPLYQVDGRMEQMAKLPAHQTARQYISLNKKVSQEGFLQTGDQLRLPAGEVTGTFRIDRISNFTGDTYSIIARGEGPSDRMLSFTVEGDRILGNIHLHNRNEHYHLSWDPDRQSNYLATVNQEALDVLACRVNQSMGVSGGIRNKINQQGLSPDVASGSHSTIDLMVVYTRDARDFMENGSSTNLFIAEIVNRSQMALDASNVLINLNLVHAVETAYDEDPNNSYQTLNRLTFMDGYMDQVHQLRDDYQADLVTMFAKVNDTGGLGWILDSHSGSPSYAFSLNRVQQLEYTYTMAHELGHNMGNHHSRNQNNSPAPAGGGLNEYSTGWRWTGDNGQGYVSVMTYMEGDQESPHFSNPDITYEGQPTGSYNGQYAPADNARSMNEIRGVLAGYRTSPVPAAPTLNSPQNGEEDVSPVTELSWSESVKADNYHLQLSTSSSFSDPLVSETVSAPNTSYQISDSLDHLTTYYWRVRASNDDGTSPYSATFNFQTVIAPPEIVSTESPLDSEFQVSVAPELSWESSARAARYIIQISTKPDFSSTVTSTETGSTTFTPSEELEYATAYYWRVRAENKGGTSDFSQPVKFTTEVDKTEITMNYPNPFRNSTTIQYQLADESEVLLEVYDTAGRKVKTLVDERQNPKVYNFNFNGTGLSSGTYIVRLLAGNKSNVLMMTLLK